MTDLKTLLDVVAGGDRPEADPMVDLAKAKAAARTRSARRLRLGAVGVVMAAVFTAVAVPTLTGKDQSSHGVELVSSQFDAAPYTFDLTPKGWHVQDQNPYAVVIAPDDGSASDEPGDFVGKLVIMFDQNPAHGDAVLSEGRKFYVSGDSDYVTIGTKTRADEPPGMVWVQYPADAGWTKTTMLAFLGSVHVGVDALPGQG